ncbi:hypothetical protein Tco_1087018 [Tanacetum coccineum]
MENFERGPYANMKTEWVSNPYLDTNRIFGRDYEASNVSCTQENQKDDPIFEPSNCKVRIFEMMKYSFNDDEEYITIKEYEYLNHSKDSLDAYQELLRLIDDGWVLGLDYLESYMIINESLEKIVEEGKRGKEVSPPLFF